MQKKLIPVRTKKCLKSDALFHKGLGFHKQGKLQEAKTLYESSLALSPSHFDSLHMLGVIYNSLGKPEKACELIKSAIRVNSKEVSAYLNLGNALKSLELFDEAIKSYSFGLKINPNHAESKNNLGLALTNVGRTHEALECFVEAQKLMPNGHQVYNNLGNSYKEIGQLDNALINYKKSYEINPDNPAPFSNYLHILMHFCNWDNFQKNLNVYKEYATNPKGVMAPFTALALLDDPKIHFNITKNYAETLIRERISFKPDKTSKKLTKIRIGYYSADFYNHATAHLIAELIENHNSERFEFYGFSFMERKDIMHKRLSRSFTQYFDVSTMNDLAVAKLSRKLGIDIAVDLKGYTAGDRPLIFSYGCAPIQVNYLGYPGTMCAEFIDYIIADKTVIPEESQQYYTEKVVYLPHSYQVNDSTRKISDRVITKAEAELPDKGFVFCCFNNNYKILPRTFDSWIRILKAVPNSVLWLFEGNQQAALNLREEARIRGISPGRLVFAKHTRIDEHLARHRLADLFIDTLPYNAHTTASDALWAGLPVLTCMGKSFAARVAASLLNTLDLPELITTTQEEYEAKAIELALDPEKLAAIKIKLERNRLTCPLFNGKLFGKNLESAYTAMYDRYRAGLKPDHIYIVSDIEKPELDDNHSSSLTQVKKKSLIPTIKIDGKDYDKDQLSKEIKDNLAAMQFTDLEIHRLQAKLAAMQTARLAYARAIKEGLSKKSHPT